MSEEQIQPLEWGICIGFIDKQLFKNYSELMERDFWGFSKIIIYSSGLSILSEPSCISIIFGQINGNIIDNGILPHVGLHNFMEFIIEKLNNFDAHLILWYSNISKSLLIEYRISRIGYMDKVEYFRINLSMAFILSKIL